MKKSVMAIMVAFTSIIMSCAQEKKVPQNVRNAFEKAHPNVKVSWEVEKDGYEAEFEINGKDASENYDFEGNKTASEIEISENELPQNVLTYLAKEYPKSKVRETAKITDIQQAVTYEVELKIDGKKQDLLFSSSGEFIKIVGIE